MTPMALMLDFDGVVLDSAGIKTAAFRELFADRPEHADAIVAHHLANQGVSRWHKIDYIHREILREPLSDAERQRRGERFAVLLEQRLLSCPEIDGARRLVDGARACAVPVFVASGTPEDELRHIVDRRGLAGLFNGVYGSPRTKSAIIGALASEHGWPADRLLLIGDSTTDLAEAGRAGARFLGLASDPGTFPVDAPTVRSLLGLSLADCWSLATAPANQNGCAT